MTEENHHPHSLTCYIKNIFSRKQNETVRETIEDLIEEANSNGEDQFSEHEQLLLNNILCLRDKKCCHAMIPRANIVAFHKDGTVKELAELMVTKGHSRIPVYGESMDDILGIIHIIDLAKCLLKGKGNTKVEDIVNREIKFVSPSMRVLDLLREMQGNKIHMAMVVDEYGGIDGLVTIEDLLEEIVGDIEDEYDFEEQHVIMLQDGGLIIADARAELDEIKDATGLDLTSDEKD
ncbi:MAG: hemolysin family protein, partial [Alphaproteobacteria bacterium]